MIVIMKAIWEFVCMFLRALKNKTDIMTQYQKECNDMSNRLNSLPGVQAILAKYSETQDRFREVL